MSSSSVCETTEERPVIAKSDTEKNGRTKARKKKELKNMEQILKSVHNLDTEAKLQVFTSLSLVLRFFKIKYMC